MDALPLNAISTQVTSFTCAVRPPCFADRPTGAAAALTDGRGRRDGQPALPYDSLWLAGLVSHRLIVLPLRKGVTRYGQRVERKMSRKQDKFYFAFYAFWSRYIHETRDKQKKFTRKSD